MVSYSLTKEDFEIAKKSYLENILEYDVRFVDPVTNSKLNISKDCISLNLQIFKTWKEFSIVKPFSLVLIFLKKDSQSQGGEKLDAVNYILSIDSPRICLLGATGNSFLNF